MSSNLDMALGDLIKSNKPAKRAAKVGAGAAGGRKAASGLVKGKRQAGRQAGTTNKKKGTGAKGAQQKQQQPRQQAKQTPVNAMRAAGRQSRQTTTANRQASGREQKLAQRRGIVAPIAVQQPVLVYTDANGQEIRQPVAVVQQPGQVGAQVIPTGAAQRSGPMFKSANRQKQQQPQQQGQQRRQNGGSAQKPARRQSGGRR